jgi:hypothetical protein
MAAGKTSGLGDQLLVGGYNISNDVGSLSRVHGGLSKTQDVTGIDKLAHERLGLLRDGGLGFNAFFNPAAAPAAHAVLSTLPTADVPVIYNRGTTKGNAGAGCIGKQINYDPNHNQDGSLLVAVEVQANGFGLEWGYQVDGGLRTDSTATSPATGIDVTDSVTVSTAFGWQAYLQVTAFAGTSVTVTLQDSADNSAFTSLTNGAFTAVTAAPASQRIAGGATDTVRRYIRAITTGTFSNAVFAVIFVRNISATAF